MEPKVKAKEIIYKVFSLIKQRLKPNPEYQRNVKKLFFDFLMSEKNKKRKYIIEIMKKMNFNGEDIIIEPDFDIFYLKFFNMAQSIFEDKDNSKEVEITITSEDLNALEDDKIKILFFYLQFSILFDNSIQIFFAFLNPEICETLLMSKLTHLDLNSLDDPKGLLNSYNKQNRDETFQKAENQKEIKLIGFEPLVDKYLNKNNNNIKNIKKNDFQIETIDKNIQKENVISPVENSNIIDLNDKNAINKDKPKVSLEEKRMDFISNKRENFSIKSEIKIMKNKNIDLLKEEKDNKIKSKGKNSSRTNLKEIYIKKTNQITPKKMIIKKDSIENNNQNSHDGKIISKTEKESPNEIKFKDNEKIDEENDITIIGEKGSLKDSNLNQLKKNLFQQKVYEYIQSQKMKYFEIYNNNYLMKVVIDTIPMHNLPFNFQSNKIKYLNLNKTLKKIRDLFSNNLNIIKPEYGYFISNEKILFYATLDSKQDNELLLNSGHLKQINYDYAAEKESSYITYTANSANDINKIDYFLVKGIDFENNWIFFFDYYFDLQKLPNIFFPISTILDNKYHHKNKKKNKFNNDLKNTFENYVGNIFNSFIEIDLARINMNNFDIQPEFFFKPFINEPPIHVYKDNNNKYICEINKNNEFKIHANTIILGEVKQSVPEKVLDIKKEEEIDPKNIQRTLFFVLFKLIKKIDYYLNYVKYEILDDSEKINNYKVQLFLIYNNKPISKMNTFIKSCLDNFISYNYIKNEFIFQIIYSSPSISSLNINNLSEEIKANNSKILNLTKEIRSLKSELENLKKKIDSSEAKKNTFNVENTKNN